MDKKDFLDSFGQISDRHISTAATPPKSAAGRRVAWRSVIAVAACVALFAAGIAVIPKLGLSQLNVTSDNVSAAPPVSNPSVSAPDEVIAPSFDLAPFFSLNGKHYSTFGVFNYIYGTQGLFGKRIGCITNGLSCSSVFDGTNMSADGSGSVTGNVYEVNGIDPDILLCMRHDDGSAGVFVNTNAMKSAKNGAELLDDMLHLSENFKTLQFQSNEYNYLDENEVFELGSSYANNVNRFISVLKKAEFTDHAELDRYDNFTHVYLTYKSGMYIHLYVYGCGYVYFPDMFSNRYYT